MMSQAVTNNNDLINTQQLHCGYDYNDPARFFRVSREDLFGKPNGPKSSDLCLHYTGEKPESKKDIENFIKKYKLHHGDIVCFGNYRDTDSYIVVRHTSGQMTWIENPDETDSGYLTIPANVLCLVTDVIGKYKCILSPEHPLISLHISPDDKFLLSELGGPVPENWKFVLTVSFGELESLSVQSPKHDKKVFSLGGEPMKQMWSELRQLMGVKPRTPKAEFSVNVNLQGDKLRKYREKYSLPSDRFGYPGALPDLPFSWSMARGPGGNKIDRLFWVWHFVGDQNEKADAISSVENFLKGFDHKINNRK